MPKKLLRIFSTDFVKNWLKFGYKKKSLARVSMWFETLKGSELIMKKNAHKNANSDHDDDDEWGGMYDLL